MILEILSCGQTTLKKPSLIIIGVKVKDES